MTVFAGELGEFLRVVVVAFAGGVGWVAVYALGLAGVSATRRERGCRSAGWVCASVCFLTAVAGVAVGLWLMLTGQGNAG
ncbi:hypothetical protein ACFYSC_30480 [Streptosporangium sp. NPDC004379]|uniref:hypothetical protein n=1 Tax=Streptosporangium sp. NPDC004379 TaxID=3366189 RepID=UPI0036A4FD8E